MASNGPWRILSTADTDEVVLACDFTAAARTEAQFADFVSHLTPPLTVWETAMPPAGVEAGWSADDYLDWWLEPLRESDVRIGAVLGFCAGSVFAAGVAERVAQLQSQPVPLAILEPELPTSPALYEHYRRAVELFAPVLERSEVDGMLTAAQDLLVQDADLQVFGPALGELYTRVAGDAMERVGLDAKRRSELTAMFVAFAHWVVAAGPLDPAEEWARAVCVRSKGGTDQPLGTGRLITVGVDHDRMLADPDVARTVIDALALGARR